MSISRGTRNQNVTVGTAAASSTSMAVGDMATGIVIVDNVTASATLTLFGSSDGGTFHALYGFDGQPATVTVPESGGACVLPEAIYALRFMRLVSGTDLGTAANVTVSFKT
ncbi:MAG: hypothetical protein ACKOEM_13770 [Planctomycetia bacterium]